MQFLKKIHDESGDFSVKALLDARLGFTETPRDYEKILHASQLTKDGFCPRRVALMEIHDKKDRKAYLPGPLQVTFETGRWVQSQLNNHWLADIMWGDWECLRCGQTKHHCKRPVPDTHCSGWEHLWSYNEVMLTDQEHNISGSMDMFLEYNKNKTRRMVECKIMAQDQWVDLKMPLAEHRIRTQLYLHLMDLNNQDGGFNCREATVLYVLRGYGKKIDGEITPFKEFTIEANPEAVLDLLEVAKQYNLWRENLQVPINALCSTITSTCAKKCPVAKQCFSGGWPAGKICAP